MENLELYNFWKKVPDNAQRTIQGGNLNGKTDINPQWRIEVLTQKFGPVGFGWVTEIIEHWDDVATIGNAIERVAWVRINLRVCVDGKWSLPIEGIGGSKYAGKGRGSELNDEAFKMAETDAISVACKKLGIGADVYWNKDATKYTDPTKQGQRQQQPPQQRQQPASQFRPITMGQNDLFLRNWLVQCFAQGYTREQCEATANEAYKVTIPNEIWQKVIEAI